MMKSIYGHKACPHCNKAIGINMRLDNVLISYKEGIRDKTYCPHCKIRIVFSMPMNDPDNWYWTMAVIVNRYGQVIGYDKSLYKGEWIK